MNRLYLAAAKRVAKGDEVEAEPGFEHIMHCSPCYASYLTRVEQFRAELGDSRQMSQASRQTEKITVQSLRRVEKIMNSVGD